MSGLAIFAVFPHFPRPHPVRTWCVRLHLLLGFVDAFALVHVAETITGEPEVRDDCVFVLVERTDSCGGVRLGGVHRRKSAFVLHGRARGTTYVRTIVRGHT
jgi:hypothetical protein